ncbi:hypothetical protein GCM10010376_76610 [Streptomyces violaceusniger]
MVWPVWRQKSTEAVAVPRSDHPTVDWTRPLLVRDTRTVVLTVDGEAMVGFARSILAAHAQAADYFTGTGVRGRLRFGVTDDLALTQVPRILRDFRYLNPGVTFGPHRLPRGPSATQSGIRPRRRRLRQDERRRRARPAGAPGPAGLGSRRGPA